MSDMIASAVGAFAKNGVKPIRYDKTSAQNLKWLGQKFKTDDPTYQASLDAFGKANDQTIADYAKLRPEMDAAYKSLFDTSRTYDPMADYERLRTGNIAALKDYSGVLEGAGSRQDKLALAALGLAGHPDSSYATALRADRVSRNTAPILGNIMANLGSDTNVIGSQRSANLGNSANLVGMRAEVPMQGYGLQLAPGQALQASRMGQLGQLQATIDAAKSNTAGWQQTTDTLGKMANAGNAFTDSLWENVGNALSVYSSLYGGGMLGGGGGIKTGAGQAANAGNGAVSWGGASSGVPTSGYSIGTGGAQPSPYAGSYSPPQPNYGDMPEQYNPWANYGGYA